MIEIPSTTTFLARATAKGMGRAKILELPPATPEPPELFLERCERQQAVLDRVKEYLQAGKRIPPDLSGTVNSSSTLQRHVFATQVPGGSGVLLEHKRALFQSICS